MYNHRDLMFQIALSFFVRIIGALSIFVLSIIVGRQLGVTEAGFFFLAFSIVTFLSAIARLGFDNTVVRFIGVSVSTKSYSDINFIFKTSITLVALFSGAVSILLFFTSEFVSNYIFKKPDLTMTLKSFSPGVFALSLLTIISMCFLGLRKVAFSIFIVNISINVFLIIIFYLFDIKSSFFAGVAWSVCSIITMIIGLYAWFSLKLPSKDPSQISYENMFSSSRPLWMVVVMSQLTIWSGQFVAGVYVSYEEVAQLAVAQRTAMLTSFILMAVDLIVAPRFASLYNSKNLVELEFLALFTVRLMIIFCLPIVAMFILYPSFFMNMFGEGFGEGAKLLQILVIGQFFNVLTGSVGYLLTMSGNERDLRNILLFTGPLSVLLAAAFTSAYGVEGCAVAIAISVTLQNLISVYYVKKRLGFNTLCFWKKITNS